MTDFRGWGALFRQFVFNPYRYLLLWVCLSLSNSLSLSLQNISRLSHQNFSCWWLIFEAEAFPYYQSLITNEYLPLQTYLQRKQRIEGIERRQYGFFLCCLCSSPRRRPSTAIVVAVSNSFLHLTSSVPTGGVTGPAGPKGEVKIEPLITNKSLNHPIKHLTNRKTHYTGGSSRRKRSSVRDDVFHSVPFNMNTNTHVHLTAERVVSRYV